MKMTKKLKKKVKKVLPVGVLILIVISVTGWALKQLIYVGLTSLPIISKMTEVQQNIVIVIVGLSILFLVGYKVEKLLK